MSDIFSAGKKRVIGDIAHDAADSGNPIKFGGKAATSTPSAVGDGDRVNAFFDEFGRLWTNLHQRFVYAYYYGGLTGGLVANDDIVFQRAATPTWPLSNDLSSTAEVLDFFDTDDSAFDDTPIWCYIPMARNNYSKATIVIRNQIGVSADVTAYMIAENSNILSVGPIAANAYRYVGQTQGAHTLVTGSGWLEIGLGTDGDDTADRRIASSWLCGGLLLKFAPASDPPGSGHWTMTVMRSR